MSEEKLCECGERMKHQLNSTRSSARAQADALKRRLNAFQEGIQQGADAIAVVHLYRAGVYLAAEKSASAEPSLKEVMHALEGELSSNRSALMRWEMSHIQEIEREDPHSDKPKMLRGILRQKSRAVGLLHGRAMTELDNAERALARAKATAERLSTWKEGVRTSIMPELYKIADIHGSGKAPTQTNE